MQQIDTVPRTQHEHEMVVEVSVPNLHLTAIRVCARADPARHSPLLADVDALRDVVSRGRYDHNGAAAAHALASLIRSHVIANDEVADEAASIMDRLATMLTSRGARIIGRDPTTVRCTRWWQRRQDWMDGVVVFGRSDCPPALSGMLFGKDYVACVHVVCAGARPQ
ncbi:hypothetical protein pkur_cds_102 [Pandoravirus kuranda]|uniref:Uncharacterized protein n=1 Tax=Pandoravirus kuranda TaxID=3019033 RepID=A0AA95J3E1_9VIRU|nr:hypothetical protein pkur_cds_102 [Pandoravirus kuranda]